MRLQLILAFITTLLLALAQEAAGQASREPAASNSAGALWGAGFWIGITLLLLIGVIIFAYQAGKRPNRD